jgi:LPXTG-site transpeptidase (sortase) family protein
MASKSQNKRKKEIKRKTSLRYILAGFILIFLTTFWQVWRAQILSFSLPVEETHNLQLETISIPTKLAIPSVGISLPVQETNIVNGVWQIPKNATGHLSSSGSSGGKTNIVIYGHNYSNILGNLKSINLGDEIFLQDISGNTHIYRVKTKVVVSPNEISWVSPTDEEVLTIYTCTGILDAYRLVVRAHPQKV